MIKYIYDARGNAVAYIQGRFIYSMRGAAIGQTQSTHVHRISGQYVGELHKDMIVDMHLGEVSHFLWFAMRPPRARRAVG